METEIVVGYPTLCQYKDCDQLIRRGKWCHKHGQQLIDMMAAESRRKEKVGDCGCACHGGKT